MPYIKGGKTGSVYWLERKAREKSATTANCIAPMWIEKSTPQWGNGTEKRQEEKQTEEKAKEIRKRTRQNISHPAFLFLPFFFLSSPILSFLFFFLFLHFALSFFDSNSSPPVQSNYPQAYVERFLSDTSILQTCSRRRLSKTAQRKSTHSLSCISFTCHL